MRRSLDLGNDRVSRLILTLALPTMLAQFINVLYSIVDRMFIGHIPEVGDLALAGVGVCGPIVTLLSSFAYLVCQGGAPLMAMKMGAGKQEDASQLLSNCFRMLLTLAVILSTTFFLLRKQLLWWFGASEETFPYALTYLSIYVLGTAFALMATGLNAFLICQGHSGLGMGTVMLGALLNLVLDPVFIFGLSMGVAGAAWATLLSQAASCFFAILCLRRKSMPVPLRWGTFNGAMCKKVVTFGVAPFLTIATDSVLLIALNTVLQRVGGPGEGDVLLTCAAIVQAYMLLITMPMGGITLGCQSIVSYNYGAGRPDRVIKALKGILTLCVSFSVIMLAVTWLASPSFVKLFTASATIQARSVTFIKIYTMFIIPLACQYVMVDQSTALGLVKQALSFSILRKALFLGFTLSLPLLFTAPAAFLAEPLCDLISCLISGAVFLYTVPHFLMGRAGLNVDEHISKEV